MITPEQLAEVIRDIKDGTMPSIERLRGLAEFAEFTAAFGSWWSEPPIPPKTIVLAWNGKAITPPMSFDDEKEAAFFQQAHQTLFWMRVPQPPLYRETLEHAPKK